MAPSNLYDTRIKELKANGYSAKAAIEKAIEEYDKSASKADKKLIYLQLLKRNSRG